MTDPDARAWKAEALQLRAVRDELQARVAQLEAHVETLRALIRSAETDYERERQKRHALALARALK